MAVLIASGLRKELAGTPLFDGVSLTVNRRDRVVLAGPNGAGKTTLLRAIVGETEIQGGEIALEKGARVALHDQRPPLDLGLTLREYVLAGAGDLVALEEELSSLEQRMSTGDHAQATLRRYSEAQARLEHAGGYAWRERVGAVARGLGFSEADLDRPLTTFSGGELTRASLSRALGGDPDLLLLDEPTNHLDVESLEWLERTLTTIDAAIVLVAHDRWFLEAVATATLELEGGRSTFFAGPWHAWREEKASRALAQARFAERQSDELERLHRFVARFRYGTKARQAQSKLKKIERIERGRVSAPAAGGPRLGFEFLQPERSGRTVVEAKALSVEVPGRMLLAGASFAIERGERVALVGPNGSGKTTLLETILGNRRPAAGEVRLGHGVKPAHFSQHDVELDGRGSVLDCAAAMTGLQRNQAAALLGRFLFSGRDAQDKPIVALSGGERRRLALAVVVASGANFLVLDEPTNHLDLESREALETALEAFPGTVLLVSHDRALLDAVATRTLAIDAGSLRSYEGGWADYIRGRAGEAAPPPSQPEKEKAPRRTAPAPRPGKRELEKVEQEITQREAAIAQLERKLAEDWADVDAIAAHRRLRDELAALLERWEALFEAQQGVEAPPG